MASNDPQRGEVWHHKMGPPGFDFMVLGRATNYGGPGRQDTDAVVVFRRIGLGTTYVLGVDGFLLRFEYVRGPDAADAPGAVMGRT